MSQKNAQICYEVDGIPCCHSKLMAYHYGKLMVYLDFEEAWRPYNVVRLDEHRLEPTNFVWCKSEVKDYIPPWQIWGSIHKDALSSIFNIHKILYGYWLADNHFKKNATPTPNYHQIKGYSQHGPGAQQKLKNLTHFEPGVEINECLTNLIMTIQTIQTAIIFGILFYFSFLQTNLHIAVLTRS